jgi:DNA invertase Pin-like site-specific DNA recombinase
MQSSTKQAAVYCRVASKDDFAMETQRLSLLRFAESKGYTGCAEYLDNGMNGLSLDRPAFNQLYADMLAGNVQVVLLKSVSRISRKTYQVFQWLDMARELGVEVISECDDLPPDLGIAYSFFREIAKHK